MTIDFGAAAIALRKTGKGKRRVNAQGEGNSASNNYKHSSSSSSGGSNNGSAPPVDVSPAVRNNVEGLPVMKHLQVASEANSSMLASLAGPEMVVSKELSLYDVIEYGAVRKSWS